MRLRAPFQRLPAPAARRPRLRAVGLVLISRLPNMVAVLACLLVGCEPHSEPPEVVTTGTPQVIRSRRLPPGEGPAPEGIPVVGEDLSAFDWRGHVGQNVMISGPLVVTDTYHLIRWGEVTLARERLYVPTNHIDPNDQDPSRTSTAGDRNVSQVAAAVAEHEAATITLDDGFDDQNVFPPRLFPELGDTVATLRLGSQLEGVVGEVRMRGTKVVLVPSAPLSWRPAERPRRPDLGDANVTVACFNVLNYFTTIDDGQNGARGADSEAERERQEDKLVAAIVGMRADVIGLIELENNLAAERRLVAAVNQQLGQDLYRACGLPERFRAAPGGRDAVRVGVIYRADRVSPLGPVTALVDDAFGQGRTPLVQAFTRRSADSPFTVVVNHLKSKGGGDEADRENIDQGDGQGAYNATRRSQARAICDYVSRRQKSEPGARILVIGDFNAYTQEDPLDVMRAAGLIDLQEQFPPAAASGQQPYSYVYYGLSGALDHAMATESMAADVTGVATWHINADELRSCDYNLEYNPAPLYEPNPFRSSDHDPVLIGIAE